jgi:hypothetical protein
MAGKETDNMTRRCFYRPEPQRQNPAAAVWSFKSSIAAGGGGGTGAVPTRNVLRTIFHAQAARERS